MDELSNVFSRFLVAQGLQPGDVVALQLPTCLHYPIAVLGAWKAGLIVTNMNPLYTAREAALQIEDSNAKLLKVQLGYVGLPLPACEVRIVGEDGHALPFDQAGELAVRGPHVVREYLNQPQKTAASMRDGWFFTGDMAVMDERGFLQIVDRKKDIILVSGLNVYPNEVEGVIAEHPDVLEVAVIGRPDASSGEAVYA